jgi:hypothetical protein
MQIAMLHGALADDVESGEPSSEGVIKPKSQDVARRFQFHGLRSLLLLSGGLILRRKFREKRAQARPRARRVTVFVTKVEVESHPFPVVGTLPPRNPGAFQPPIKIVQYFS